MRFGKEAGIGVVALAFPFAASASLMTPVSQDRTLDVQTEVVNPEFSDSDADHVEAVAFELFDRSASCFSQIGDPPFQVTASSLASQRSEFFPKSVSATGHVEMAGQGDTLNNSLAGGSSVFSFTFSLSSDADFILDADVNAAADFDAESSATVILSDSNGEIATLSALSNSTDSRQFTGTLPAGTYFLEAFASGSASGSMDFPESTAGADFNLEFSIVPEPAALVGLLVAGMLLRRRS